MSGLHSKQLIDTCHVSLLLSYPEVCVLSGEGINIKENKTGVSCLLNFSFPLLIKGKWQSHKNSWQLS